MSQRDLGKNFNYLEKFIVNVNKIQNIKNIGCLPKDMRTTIFKQTSKKRKVRQKYLKTDISSDKMQNYTRWASSLDPS